MGPVERLMKCENVVWMIDSLLDSRPPTGEEDRVREDLVRAKMHLQDAVTILAKEKADYNVRMYGCEKGLGCQGVDCPLQHR